MIDFPLSNCQRAVIAEVWVLQQYNRTSLSDHLANGRPWDLDRTTGGLLVLHRHQGGDERSGWHQGTADALWRNAPMCNSTESRTLAPASILTSGEITERFTVPAMWQPGDSTQLSGSTQGRHRASGRGRRTQHHRSGGGDRRRRPGRG